LYVCLCRAVTDKAVAYAIEEGAGSFQRCCLEVRRGNGLSHESATGVDQGMR
jgi:bacterioferritin-associated ferredoxin